MSDTKFSAFANEVRALVHEFMGAYNEADREEKACCDVTLSQCCTLLAFHSIDEQLTMNALSSRLGLSTSTMTRNVDGLVRKGYIARTSSERDRRQVLVQLTANGKEMAERLRCCERDLFSEALGAIPADQWESVVSALRLLLNAIHTRKENCC
ncbi:MarR family transcriptional regulator [Candidatus Poribacteria bacterium]|nr:MarR family transcriptional regulator [Candidatus Poribacteria bacterium]